MNERLGVGVAILSSSFGAGAAVATRYLIGAADPFTLAAIRFGGGVLCLLPLALLLGVRWPQRGDWPAVAGLGFMFYAVFFVFYNVALAYTTVARGTLALSTLPLMTMLVGALLGIEALSARKTTGVLLAMLGVSIALATGLAHAPAGAWRGDLIMAAATLCMALYNVWSRPYIQRSSALGFLTLGMAVGGGALVLISLLSGGAGQVARLGPVDWIAAIYLAAGGGALAFFLWVYALQHASPTRVANTMAVNPLVAGVLAAILLGEPITLNLAIGLLAVFAGIWIATTDRPAPSPRAQTPAGH
ncbi:MAG TPA: DMT family transporter [Hyphomicrobiaceae bacterium]|nr:DMT family transporter [Hyphomicrobiaceae bacterium]